ncbi:MAG: hypothetical protein PHU33_16510 [Bacteroidales bacterium]|nr:hypothetical protein [Bacteroidales bacterium]
MAKTNKKNADTSVEATAKRLLEMGHKAVYTVGDGQFFSDPEYANPHAKKTGKTLLTFTAETFQKQESEAPVEEAVKKAAEAYDALVKDNKNITPDELVAALGKAGFDQAVIDQVITLKSK